MKRTVFIGLLSIITIISCQSPDSNKADSSTNVNREDMMIRITEIEIDSAYLDEYIAILKEESAASIKLEKGVLCIYPMYQKENPTEIRLLEIYANKEAYEAHLQTSHFQHYKTTTLEMVKSLKLVEMEAIDKETMVSIFKKLEQ